MNEFVLEFERPIAELEKRIRDMKEVGPRGGADLSQEIRKLENRAEKLRCSKLTQFKMLEWRPR